MYRYGAVIALSLMLAGPAGAKDLQFSAPESRDWSAAAFDPDGSRGLSSNETSEANARSTAYTRCPSKCDFIVTYQKGQCVAVAAYGNKPYGYANAYSRESSTDAEDRTLARCSNRGIEDCRIVFSGCG